MAILGALPMNQSARTERGDVRIRLLSVLNCLSGLIFGSFTAHHLVVNPRVRLLQALGQRRRRLPTEMFSEQRIITIPSTHALRRAQIIGALQVSASDLFDNIHKLVDAYQFLAAQIERLLYGTVKDQVDAAQAVVDIH